MIIKKSYEQPINKFIISFEFLKLLTHRIFDMNKLLDKLDNLSRGWSLTTHLNFPTRKFFKEKHSLNKKKKCTKILKNDNIF